MKQSNAQHMDTDNSDTEESDIPSPLYDRWNRSWRFRTDFEFDAFNMVFDLWSNPEYLKQYRKERFKYGTIYKSEIPRAHTYCGTGEAVDAREHADNEVCQSNVWRACF